MSTVAPAVASQTTAFTSPTSASADLPAPAEPRPEWEIDTEPEIDWHALGVHLATATATAVRDPDWIAAALTQIVKTGSIASVEPLLAAISLWTATADREVAAITNRPLPPAFGWSRQGGGGTRHLCGHFEDETHAALWAGELQLVEHAAMPGAREWIGVIDGWVVTVWAVADRDAFEAQAAANRHFLATSRPD